MGYETNKTCALKSIEQNGLNIPDLMIEMDTLTFQMQNNLQEFIFDSLKLSAFGALKIDSDSSQSSEYLKNSVGHFSINDICRGSE